MLLDSLSHFLSAGFSYPYLEFGKFFFSRISSDLISSFCFMILPFLFFTFLIFYFLIWS